MMRMKNALFSPYLLHIWVNFSLFSKLHSMSSVRWFPVEVALYPAAVKEDEEEEEFTVMTTLECDIHLNYNNVVFAPTFQIELTESAQ